MPEFDPGWVLSFDFTLGRLSPRRHPSVGGLTEDVLAY